MKLMGFAGDDPASFSAARQHAGRRPASCGGIEFRLSGHRDRLNATTEPEMPASPSTVAIVVERLLKGEHGLRRRRQEITLQLRPAA